MNFRPYSLLHRRVLPFLMFLALPASGWSEPVEEVLPEGVAEETRFTDGDANAAINETAAGSPKVSQNPLLDKIWSLPVIYKNYERPLLQEVSFFGRYHGQYYMIDSEQGSADGWENRRLRLGVRAVVLQNWTLGVNYNFNEDAGGSISDHLDGSNLDTLTLAWTPENKGFQLVIGQQKPGFTYEYETSSNRILTFERSMLVNQLAPDKSAGISAEGKFYTLQYAVGVYSDRAIGEGFDAGLGLLKLGYDYSEASRYEKAGVQLYYLYRSGFSEETSGYYRHSLSLSGDLQEGPYSLLCQVMYGNAFGDNGASDVWGAVVMPSLFVYEKKLQVVARYQYAASKGEDGLQVQKRYEQKVPLLTNSGLGDRYQAVYVGLNWYVYGSRLKFMTGVEYSTMDGGSDGGDYDGWTWFNGVRLFF